MPPEGDDAPNVVVMAKESSKAATDDDGLEIENKDDYSRTDLHVDTQSNSAADKPTSSIDDGRLNWPEERGDKKQFLNLNLEYKKWTYSYMNPILQKGNKQTSENDGTKLQHDDLYRVPRSMESKFLVKKFEDHYSTVPKETKRRLLWTLWHLSKPTSIPGGLCQLVAVLCQVLMPLLVRQLLRVLEENPKSKVINEGLPYALGIFFCLVLNAFANHRHRHLAMKTGIILRSCLVGVIYERVLRLQPRGRQGLTSGEVTTLVAIDTQKLFEVTQEAHLIWSMPLSMTLVMICLLIVMGPTTIVGLVVFLLFVPLIERIVSKIQFIRHKRVKLTDRRVEIVNSMLQGIKVTKLNNYEEKYKQRIEETRKEEHGLLEAELAFWATSLVTTVVSPMFAAAGTFATYVLVNEDNVLTAAQTFTVLLLFIALRFPISYFGRLMGRVAQAMEASRRIEAFMNRPVRDAESDKGTMITGDDTPDACEAAVLSVENASFRVGATLEDSSMLKEPGDNERSPALLNSTLDFEASGVDITLKRGETLALVGPVGSGKSTIINGILGEIPALSGTNISMNGRVSYVSQTPFILNATLRDNILFGLDFDSEWYEKVLDACCLRQDLRQLGAAGDLTEIGERGVTLSGGQKQRVSLARAAYARPDLVLMDDPISALDAGTARAVFDHLIGSSNSILSNSAIVLVTHASHFLNRVDRIMVVVDGKSQFVGRWDELLQYQPTDPKQRDAIEHIRSSVQEVANNADENSAKPKSKSEGNLQASTKPMESTNISDGKLMTVEEREHGISSLRTWLLWFQRAGGLPFIAMMLFLMAFDRVAYVASEYWLARWTQGAFEPVAVFELEFPAQSDGRSAQFDYLKVYALILLIGTFSTFCRSVWAVSGGARCSKNMFLSMLSSVLKAPVSYFETTPLGRILNRFTYDIEVIDVTLTEAMSICMISLGWFITGVTVMISILPYMALALLPAVAVYWFLLLHYRRCGTDLQRLDAVARSPIQAIVSEGLDGSATIRVFGQVRTFVSKFYLVVDESSSALLNFVSAQRWLGFRIELIGSSIVLCSCVLVITLNDTLDLEPGIAALLIIWSSNFTVTLGFMVDYFAEGEAAITSIERVDAMLSIDHEKEMSTPKSMQPKPTWPEKGTLQFESVSLRYRDGLPLALNSLSFTIPAGSRCGVVGRTGAGKSSLTVALFRLVEIESGTILLDGVDLGKLGLADVRGRLNGMAIIPQDPFIAGTTLRECLDPFGSSTEQSILDALVSVRLADASSGLSVLDDPVSEGGSNFSVGERQLLNLARALLYQPKLLVLDEATASIDGETDAFIQRMLRTRFKDTTLVTVAHRLNTIMDYDFILVMDNGQAVEFGRPDELLKSNGVFAELVDSTGAESSRALREVANSRSPITE